MNTYFISLFNAVKISIIVSVLFNWKIIRFFVWFIFLKGILFLTLCLPLSKDGCRQLKFNLKILLNDLEIIAIRFVIESLLLISGSLLFSTLFPKLSALCLYHLKLLSCIDINMSFKFSALDKTCSTCLAFFPVFFFWGGVIFIIQQYIAQM